MPAINPITPRRPAECLTCGVEQNGRRFFLCLVAAHYGSCGVAVFTEVTADDGPDGEPRHDTYQDCGTWNIDSTDEGPSTLKVDLMPSDNLSHDEGSAIMNALLEQIGDRWSDSWEWWA
jgi:hypothetical protein